MSEGERFTVRVRPLDAVFEAAAEQTLLRAAREAGVVLPSSCRNGTCRACLARLVEGVVDYVVDWPGVSREEKAEGFILPCVARARSPLLIDAAGASWSPTPLPA